MNDAERRKAFQTWFEGPPMNGDREALIKRTGYTKGRISQFFNQDEQFGERAARTLAKRLNLQEEFFNTPSTQRSNAQGASQATITPFPATTLDAVMERLSHYLAQVPLADRGQSSAALAALALQPEDFARKTRHLRSLIEPTDHADETATGTDHAQKL